jgi:cation diffusion facilitator CzcD-associated flavoprotein CzcO
MSEQEYLDAIVVGAGVGGLYAIHRLRKLESSLIDLRRQGRPLFSQ